MTHRLRRLLLLLPLLGLVAILGLQLLRPYRLAHLSPQAIVDPGSLTGQFAEDELAAYFDNQPLSAPSAPPAQALPTSVLGQSADNKRIEVDLANQRLYAYEGDRQVFNFLISSGKWGRTPTGTFRIWTKLRYTKMEGGKKELNTYYYLPNVPYVMYFYNDDIPKYRGFGLHGTYWHSNFGHPMSHGCVNMKTEEAALLYYWANPDLQGKQSIFADDSNLGTSITIYGQAPLN